MNAMAQEPGEPHKGWPARGALKRLLILFKIQGPKDVLTVRQGPLLWV